MNISNPAEGRIDREPELAGLGGGQAGVLSSFDGFSVDKQLIMSLNVIRRRRRSNSGDWSFRYFALFLFHCRVQTMFDTQYAR